MKDGERIVWAAAFAAGMARVDVTDGSQESVLRGIGQASAQAFAAVVALRSAAALTQRSEFAERNHPGWTMLRDMAGLSH